MHLLINALPIHPGGGLTVVRGLIDGLGEVRPAWRITALCRAEASFQSLTSSTNPRCAARRIDVGPGVPAYWWQRRRLGAEAKRLGANALLAINHHLPDLDCPQVIYHLNLRRFQKSYRSLRPTQLLAEWLRDQAAKRALRQADANVFESQFLLDAARDLYRSQPKKAEVTYIGLAKEWTAERVLPAKAKGPWRLATVTSRQPHKDNPTLIRTLAELVRSSPERDWRLDIVGGGDALAWAPERRMAESLGLGDRIQWLGYRSPSEIIQTLDGVDAFVLTSQMESLAMTAIEAMARGVPTVVSDCAAMPESVAEAGLLARPGDAASFADAIRRIAENPDLRQRLVQAGRQRAGQFTWSECAEKFAATFERTLGVHRPYRQAA